MVRADICRLPHPKFLDLCAHSGTVPLGRRTKGLESFSFVFIFAACRAAGCHAHPAAGRREADRREPPGPALALRDYSSDRTLAPVKERSRHSPSATHGLVLPRV